MSRNNDLGDGHQPDYYVDYLTDHGMRDGQNDDNFNFDNPSPFPRTRIPPSDVNAIHATSDVDSAQFAQHHTLGPRHNQAAPGDHIHDGGTSKGFSWTQFTNGGSPIWTSDGGTQPSIGSGAVSARYVKLGTLVIYHFELLFATNTTFGTGNWLFALPFAARPAAGEHSNTLTGLVKGYSGDTNTNAVGAVFAANNSQVAVVSHLGTSPWGATVPLNWVANLGNHLNGQITYESAS